MGRKLDTEKPKRGPGPKAKRQQDPILPKALNDSKTTKALSSHQKKRRKIALEKELLQKQIKKEKAEKALLKKQQKEKSTGANRRGNLTNSGTSKTLHLNVLNFNIFNARIVEMWGTLLR